jgi:hypothetical protein
MIGYYKSGFLIIQNAWYGSYRSQFNNPDEIIADIHKLRFDPSKPYLISGDQFSVLYPRNLGVFYNSLLNPYTAHSRLDWTNRQRIYLHSAMYALDAFSSARRITTTLVPIFEHSVALTQVHPGSVASDSLYGVLHALNALSNERQYSHPTYKLQAVQTVHEIIRDRQHDLKMLLEIYLHDVQDPKSGLVKRKIHLSSARDGALRDSSFYDNVILWKTLQLADHLGIDDIPNEELNRLKKLIIKTYWDEEHGYFRDDMKHDTYSSDWLIALPAGFLSLKNKKDLDHIKRCVAYTKKHKIDEPFPIRYTAPGKKVHAPWAVRTFVPNYGGDAIWSYWGAQYITLLAELFHITGNEDYRYDARRHIQAYHEKIIETQGFPETFDSSGNFLQTPVYKSIRQTGWVVQFEAAKSTLERTV